MKKNVRFLSLQATQPRENHYFFHILPLYALFSWQQNQSSHQWNTFSTHPPFTKKAGSLLTLNGSDYPCEFFEAIFGSDTFDLIADQSNLYATQSNATWEETSSNEIKVFIGMILAMGVHKLPYLRDYWSQNPLLGAPGITKSMPRDRFKAILRYLHLNDNSQMPARNDANFDKLYKVRPLLEAIKENTQKAYYPHQQLAIDEAMVLFKGRSSIKQFMPLKPIKRGYKVWCICDSTNGLAYDIEIYLGATGGNSELNLGERVVLRLIDKIKGESHQIYMDNFFTSPALSLALYEKQTFMIGTVRVGRKGFPESLKDTKTFSKTLQRGDYKSCLIHDGKTECLVWMDKKPVSMVNSISDPSSMTHVKRTAKDGSRLQVPCPESIKLYNAYMGGVDLFDFRRKTYSCSRKSKKWWLRLFYFLVDMAVTNAYIVYRESPNSEKLTQKDFVLQVADRLISSHCSRKRSAQQDPPSSSRQLGRHFPDRQEKTKNCRICEDRKRTVFCCRECCPSDPVPLCPVPCFKLFHTLDKLPSKRPKKTSS